MSALNRNTSLNSRPLVRYGWGISHAEYERGDAAERVSHHGGHTLIRHNGRDYSAPTSELNELVAGERMKVAVTWVSKAEVRRLRRRQPVSSQ